jgi:hypothetical protein
MNKTLLAFLFFALGLVGRANPVISVSHLDGWFAQDAPAEMMARLQASGITMVDLSFWQDSGIIVQTLELPPATINSDTAGGILLGYKKGIESAGGSVDSSIRAKVGDFPAYRITGRIGEKSIIAYVIFATDRPITVRFERDGSLGVDDPAVGSYLSRLSFAKEATAGSIDSVDVNSVGFKIGEFVGMTVLPLLLLILPVGVFFLIKLIWRKLRPAHKNMPSA